MIAEANSKKSIEDRVTVLRHYNSFPLRHILRGVFDPNIRWLIDPANIQYKPCVYVDQYNRLMQEAKRLYLFVDGARGTDPFTGQPQPNLPQQKLEMLFVQMLETLDPLDARLMMEVVTKDLPSYKRITSEVVLQAFPGLY